MTVLRASPFLIRTVWRCPPPTYSAWDRWLSASFEDTGDLIAIWTGGSLEEINSEVRALGTQIVVHTPELERHTRALHKEAEPDNQPPTSDRITVATAFRE